MANRACGGSADCPCSRVQLRLAGWFLVAASKQPGGWEGGGSWLLWTSALIWGILDSIPPTLEECWETNQAISVAQHFKHLREWTMLKCHHCSLWFITMVPEASTWNMYSNLKCKKVADNQMVSPFYAGAETMHSTTRAKWFEWAEGRIKGFSSNI